MKKTALLADGSALFFTTRALGGDKPLDYRRLEERLKEEYRLKSFDVTLFFTAYNLANESQQKFLAFIRDTMRWTLDAVPWFEAVVPPSTYTTLEGNEPRPFIRFDARIAFSLGRLAGVYDQVVLVSDSYPLAWPMVQAIKKGTAVNLAFFAQSLDPRWIRYFRGPSPEIKLFDLDRFSEELFGLKGGTATSFASEIGLP
jgi:hypothetical protein